MTRETMPNRSSGASTDTGSVEASQAKTQNVQQFILGFEAFLTLVPALNKAKLPEGLVLGVLDGDEACIDGLSQMLLNRLAERKHRSAAGETHLVRREQVVSDSLVNRLAWIMLEVTRGHELELRPLLVALLRFQLCGSNPSLIEDLEISQKRDRAVLIACKIKLAGEEPSLHKVAKLLEVPTSTVSRWFPDGDLGDRAHELAISVVSASTPEGWLEALRK